MTPNYENEFQDPSEYGRGRGGDPVTPNGQPRKLSTRERAQRLRSAGIRDEVPEAKLGESGFDPGIRLA